MSTDNNRKKYSQRRKGRAQGFYGSLVDKLKLGLAAGSDRGYAKDTIGQHSAKLLTTSLEDLELVGGDEIGRAHV